MVRRFGYWRDSVIRKHNWNKKRPYYESLIRSLEPPKKKRQRANRVLKNGQWVRKNMSEEDLMNRITDQEYKKYVGDGELIMKQRVLSIIQSQLDSIKEARKDTTGLGMLEHSVKMILMEIERL